MPPPPARCPRLFYHAVLLNPLDQVLGLHAVGDPDGLYKLPGVVPNHNGWVGLATAVRFATGLEVAMGRQLATDLTPADPQTATPAYRHRVRSCGLVPQNHHITLGRGLDHHRWLAADEVAAYCGPAAPP
ncbi:hypothetical protein [Streptomyces sp. NPDC045470]|uniref:hypothetical protein n=1 Tax=Streptomyces sp. NPDC045470 TaxID=3155469 RepID=UPI0033E1C0A5